MKQIKFFKSEKDHFSEKIFRNIEKTSSKFKYMYINFRDLFRLL